MNIVKYIKNFINYIKTGGVTYVEINQIHDEKILNGKNIVITGGTSGIGYSIAKKCVDLGASVLVTGRNLKKLQQVKSELKCEVVEWDISNIDSIHEKVKEVIEVFGGKIDCWINNAGMYKEIRYNDCNIDDWNKIMNTNLAGVYFASKEIILQCFEKNKKGNIINIASNRGIIGDDGPYGISKAGVINLTQGFAKKLINKNIRINAINPGMTASNINNFKDTDNLYKDSLKGKRIMTSNEIAEVAIFLISDSSSGVTGQIINCDNAESVL